MGAEDTQWSPGKATPYRHADGRPKASPDETSMFGLNAVWSEMDKTSARQQQQHTSRRSRHSSRAGRRPVWPLVAVIIVAVLCAIAMIWMLMNY